MQGYLGPQEQYQVRSQLERDLPDTFGYPPQGANAQK